MIPVAAASTADVMHEQLDYLIEVGHVHAENRYGGGDCMCSLCRFYRATELGLMALFKEPALVAIAGVR